MKFHVLGANKETGDDVEVDLVAADTTQAESIAHDRGILVASLKAVDGPVALDTIELEPESESTTTTAAHNPTPDPHAGNSHNAHAPNHDAHAPAGHAPANHDAHAPHAPHDAHAHGHGHAHPEAHHADGAPHSSTHIEYRVLLNQSLFLMEKAVCRALEEGWEPTGGIATAFQNNATSYFQAMIRYPKPTESTQE